MPNIITEKVTGVHHWNDSLFSFTTTRSPSFTFENGHFVTIGLIIDGKPLMRAYSIVSANYEDHLEFFSIKVPDGPLTSRLQHIQPGDEILLSTKPTGTLIADHLLPGKNLYLLSTGTGLAPFISIVKDPHLYDRFDHIILTHCVREVSDLAYQSVIRNELPNNPWFGDSVKRKLLYFPTVTRETFEHQGRLTDWITTGELPSKLGLPPINPEADRFMLCGSTAMLKEMTGILVDRGFEESRHGHQAHFVTERAFVER